MTAKKALEKIGSTTYYDWNNIPLSEHFKEEFDRVDKSLTELEELKRYPTADEVCEALSEFYRKLMMDIYYDEKLNSFCYGEYGDISVEVGLDKNGNLKIKEYLPPHLITLIGRFYEGLEKVGKE